MAGEDAVAAFQDPELMAAYDKTPTLFAPDIYENILNMTAYTCFNKLFNDNGTVDGDAPDPLAYRSKERR